jgi:hypothetical protein
MKARPVVSGCLFKLAQAEEVHPGPGDASFRTVTHFAIEGKK